MAPISFRMVRLRWLCMLAFAAGGIGLCRSATRAPKPSVDCGCIRSQPQPVLGLGVLLFGRLRNHGIKRKTHRDSLDEVAVNYPVHHAAQWFSHVEFAPWFAWAVFLLWPDSDL